MNDPQTYEISAVCLVSIFEGSEKAISIINYRLPYKTVKRVKSYVINDELDLVML